MTAKNPADEPVVLIYDDEHNSALGIKEQLSGIPNVDLRLLDHANDEVEVLERRRRAARSDGPGDDEESVFDRADILIVDYDLTSSEEETWGARRKRVSGSRIWRVHTLNVAR